MTRSFRKPFADPVILAKAQHNHAWLSSFLPAGQVPDLLERTDGELRFQYVAGHSARIQDVNVVANMLATHHASAYKRGLSTASMPAGYVSGSCRLPGFAPTRAQVLRQRLNAYGSTPTLDESNLEELLERTRAMPVAFYKDTNLRNVIITSAGPVIVDFDDVTLAPFGYDLAKLLVSLGMTYSELPGRLVADALTVYNSALAVHDLEHATVSRNDFWAWLDMHDLLTAPYIGRNGYRHRWFRACREARQLG